MDSIEPARRRLAMLDRPAGEAARDLRLGCGVLRFEGLTAAAARTLDARWGGFVGPAGNAVPDLLAHAVRGDGAVWLPPWGAGEAYRMEADVLDRGVFACSYHFALAGESPGRFKVSFVETDAEPFGRVLDNLARYLVARLAAGRGGFALHGAGVLRHEHAWIFAGPSGAGKSTAARNSGAASLGDDFAIVVPRDDAFATCALPFDNKEQAPPVVREGLIPLAAVVRMFKASSHRVEKPVGAVAEASLIACTAFRLAGPELEGATGDALSRFATSGAFLHLHAALDGGFWPLLEGAV